LLCAPIGNCLNALGPDLPQSYPKDSLIPLFLNNLEEKPVGYLRADVLEAVEASLKKQETPYLVLHRNEENLIWAVSFAGLQTSEERTRFIEDLFQEWQGMGLFPDVFKSR